jgi:hypothetical protein
MTRPLLIAVVVCLAACQPCTRAASDGARREGPAKTRQDSAATDGKTVLSDAEESRYCELDKDCPKGFRCLAFGQGPPLKSCLRFCNGDSECPEDEICVCEDLRGCTQREIADFARGTNYCAPGRRGGRLRRSTVDASLGFERHQAGAP